MQTIKTVRQQRSFARGASWAVLFLKTSQSQPWSGTRFRPESDTFVSFYCSLITALLLRVMLVDWGRANCNMRLCSSEISLLDQWHDVWSSVTWKPINNGIACGPLKNNDSMASFSPVNSVQAWLITQGWAVRVGYITSLSADTVAFCLTQILTSLSSAAQEHKEWDLTGRRQVDCCCWHIKPLRPAEYSLQHVSERLL